MKIITSFLVEWMAGPVRRATPTHRRGKQKENAPTLAASRNFYIFVNFGSAEKGKCNFI